MTMAETMDNKSGNRPLMSFVVTYHNEDISMLRECLTSILSLSLSKAEKEVIVVDDGSDICPMNELMEYGDNVIYVRKPNGGLGSARNLGITIATGTYMQFVDADDYLITAEYERCLDVARYKNPDMVMFNITRNNKVEQNMTVVDETPVAGVDFMRQNNLRGTSWGYLFKKDVIHNLRFPADIVHEDEEFTPQLVLRCERIFSLDSVAYFYRVHSNRITTSNDNRWKLRRLDDTETVIMRLHRRSDTLPYEERQALRRRIAQLTMDYLHNVIVLTRSRRFLDERIETLEREGLFPLPEKAYTRKYAIFSKMVKTSVGRNILLATLPIISHRK